MVFGSGLTVDVFILIGTSNDGHGNHGNNIIIIHPRGAV